MHTALSNNKVIPDLLVRSGYFFALFYYISKLHFTNNVAIYRTSMLISGDAAKARKKAEEEYFKPILEKYDYES